MHRKTRRTAIHLALFSTLLTLLLLTNRPPNESRTFPWTKIRYASPLTTLSASASTSFSPKPAFPDSHGTCPGLSKSLKKPVLVVSHIDADGGTDWLTESGLAKKYHLCIYDVDAPILSKRDTLRVPANRAHESITYLTFLISNYDSLPPTGVVFVHGSRFAWHNDSPDYDNAGLLADLNVENAIEGGAGYGYHNLRCDWSVGTCGDGAVPQGSLQIGLQAVLDPWDGRVVSDAGLPGALGVVFGSDTNIKKGRAMLGRHDVLRAQCCAQFVVSREAIRRHERGEYVALREWLLDGSISSTSISTTSNSRVLRQAGITAAPKDDKVAGRILSYMWHILFLDARVEGSEEEVDLGKLNRMACPTAQECYCRLYGRCGLERCRAGSCGVYRVPPGYKVPKGILEGA
ncbi:hypothetical protein BDV12DRAFT_196853 [Aspergillus spectabilis]